MQTLAFSPQDWLSPLPGKRLVEWIKVLALLAGVGAIPLLAPILGTWAWTVSLAAGLLLVGLGLYSLFRSGRQARAQARAEHSAGVLAEAHLTGRTIQVTARRKKPADTGKGDILAGAGAGNLRQGTWLILFGMLILLPAGAAPLLSLAEIPQPHLVTAFLGSPALVLWIVFESLAIYASWQPRPTGQAAILGLVCSAAQALAAFLIWIFLGLSYAWGAASTSGLFWAGAGLALVGAVAGTLIPSASRQPNLPLEQDELPACLPSSEPAGTRAGLAAIPEVEAGAQAPAPQPGTAGSIEAPAGGETVTAGISRAVFQVFRGVDGQYYFRLCAANGEIILSSEGYRAKRACHKGIASVRQNALRDERFVRAETRDGQYSFVLNAANHQVIGSSESYTTPAGREAGIRAVMRVAPLAGVEEVK
jgi:hypothetical protein